MTTFFDTSALIALTKNTEIHHQWSKQQFESSKNRGPIIISPIVFSEFSIAIPSLREINVILTSLGIEIFPDRHESLFRAGRAYLKYRDHNKGPKTSLLPDFLIGAAAENSGLPLVTTNRQDFVKYFESINLISPA